MASFIQDKEDGNWVQPVSRRKDTITYATTITFAKVSSTSYLRLDANVNYRYMAATGACTFAAPTSGIDSDTELTLEILCDGTDRTMTFGTGFEAHASTMAIESATTAIITFRYNTAGSKFIEVSRSVTVAS